MKSLTLRTVAGAAALLATVTVGMSLSTTASAAPAAAPAVAGSTGWLRVAHLSADTKAVDVRISSLAGGAILYELDDVAYGTVSKYMSMADGVYTIAMVPAGSAATTKPMLSASVNVLNGKASTVAAFGKNKDLDVKVYTDDLTTPSTGQARIRLIQAATVAPSVDVATTTGITLADNAKTGTATGYAQVAAGSWTVDITGKKVKNTANVNLADGSVTTLLVLDTTGGGVTVEPVLDSAAVGATPVGGVQTGGGYLALHHEGSGLSVTGLSAVGIDRIPGAVTR